MTNAEIELWCRALSRAQGDCEKHSAEWEFYEAWWWVLYDEACYALQKG